MPGMYNMSGWGGLFDNFMTNAYNDRLNQYNYQRNYLNDQYQNDLDYYNQMNDYDRQQQGYNMWSSGAARGAPIQPREAPDRPFIGAQPTRPRFNFGNLFGGFGGGGGFKATAPPGGGGWNPSEFQGPGYQAPEGWNNPGIDTANMVDPSAVIASAQPGIMEKMNNAFADAGNRFGSSGMVGTPYADALGDASRSAANDIANITNQYQYQSALDAAQREQERAMAEYAADYNSWAQSGDWAHQGQLADMNQNFGAWSQLGDWQNSQALQQGDLANQQWLAQNNWGFQDYTNQQNMMSQLLPMLFGAMGGMF